MSFWTFCCKFPQAYRPFGGIYGYSGRSQYPNTQTRAGAAGIPELDGCSDPSIDNEGDWICLSDEAGILSDGTLWCWNADVVYIETFKKGLAGERDRPVKISDDTDWTFVTASGGRGFAIKSDKSLWAFGMNSYGCHGIGIGRNAIGVNGASTSHYRARLSTGIKSVHSITTTNFGGTPTATVTGGQAGDIGTGATFSVEWSGAVRSIVVTSGGSYLSTPTATLVGTGDDAGKTLAASSVTMSGPTTASLVVVSGGSGYTFATARSILTGATANAVIENGVIVGWTLTNQGRIPATQAYADSETFKAYMALYPVVVAGDGDGGVASLVFGPAARSVTAVTFPQTEMWTAVPNVVFSGGDGTGAVAQPSSSGITGTVKSITVTSPGSGYTQQSGYYNKLYITLTHATATVARGASVNLIPSTVDNVIQAATSLPALWKQSDGKLFPFTFGPVAGGVGYAAAGSEVFIVKSDGSRIDISSQVVSVTGVGMKFSSPSIITGCTHPPFIRIYTKPTALTATSPLGYFERRVPTTYCGEPPYISDVYVTPGIGFGNLFPIATESLSISGRGSAEYVNIEGNLVLVSRTREKIGQDEDWWDGGGPRAPRPQPPYPTYTASRYTGRTSSSTCNALALEYPSLQPNWGQSASLYGSGRFPSIWTTPTLEQKARIYFTPPEYGGESPYAEATPVGGDVVMGYGTSPAIVSDGGGLYDIEPSTLAVYDCFEYPVRVGTDSWKSVSMKENSSYGVKDDGSLWWWGESTANGARDNGLVRVPCVSPAPVGQGVTVDVTVDGDMRVTKMSGVMAFDVPQSGVFFKNEIANVVLVADTKPNVQSFENQTLPIKSSSFSTGVKYHPPDRDVVTLSSYQFGLGYTSTPAIEYLHAGAPAATFTPRLVGPASFTEVAEDCAKASDGTWYRVGRMRENTYLSPEPFVSGPVSEYHYVKTTTNPNTNDPDSITTSTVRTLARNRWPATISVINGGAGYTTATVSVAYNYRLEWIGVEQWSYSNVVSDRNTVTCERFNSVTGGRTYFDVDTNRTDTLTVTRLAALNSASQSSAALSNGSVKPFALRLDPVDASSVQASISGDGSGATIDISHQTQLIVSPMKIMAAPGCESLRLTCGICKSSNSLSSVPYQGYTFAPLPYTIPRYQGIAKVDGWTFTDNNDRVFKLTRPSDPLDLPSVPGFRVFSAKLTVDSTGSGYGDVATAAVSQQSGVAKAKATYSGSVMAIGVLNAGYGYPSPPTVTLTTQDGVGTPGTAQAVIAGPVDRVSLSSGGSGYRIAPEVVFSGQGIHARATCTINSSGSVDAVMIEKGGRYRNTPPTVTFVPVKQVESLTLGAGGSHYTSAPDVYIGSGGGTGATATARINGVVEDITLLSGGAGYSEAPQVIIDGEASTAATASCRIKAKVVNIIVTNAGSGYKTKPTVSISGGGGSGATAEAMFDLPDGLASTEIYSIQLTGQGDDYQTAPTVTITGGQGTGATAIAVISGPVDSVSIENQGQGYREQPLVRFSGGGGGFGARATATLNGTVDQITLVNRGRDYVQPPEIVFYNGGGGSGATATATLSSPGSGAAGNAVLNGSIIFCTYTGSSGLQVEPTATVSHSDNYAIAELSQRLSNGGITQSEYDAAMSAARARLKTRISGKVTGATIQTPGSLYEQTTSRNARSLNNPTSPALAMIRDEMAEYTTGGKGDGRRAKNIFYGGHTQLTGTVVGGSVTALTPSSSLSSWEFWRCPEVVMSDGISAIPQTCLMLKAAAVRSGAAVNTGTIEPSGVKLNGVTAARLPTGYATGTAGSVDILSPSGQLLSTSNYNSGYSFNNANGESARKFVASLYSTLPTVTVEDEAGTGATIGALGATVAASGGSGYTLGARLVMKGGTPKSWSNKAILQAVVVNGSVTAINITNGGLGYHRFPKIIITGGGGTGARAIAYSGYPNNSVNLVVITNNGRGYTSTPTVVVIDSDTPVERLQLETELSTTALRYEYGVDTVSTPVLTNYTIEFCMLSPTQSPNQMTIDSPVGLLSGADGAQFAPFFEDDGYVEGVYWSFLNYNSYTPVSDVVYMDEGYFCGNRDFVDVPAVTPVGVCSQPAVLTAQVVSWSNVSSENTLKTKD